MENAQKIADEIMKIVPYDINITDTNGIILASGDRSTVGSLHKSALITLKKKEAHIVYETTDTEEKGISLPVLYNNCIVGVICICGEVEDVMMIGQICMSIALLMLENQILNEMSAIKASRLKDFLFDWITKKEEEYDEAFYDQAAYLKVDLSIQRTAVIFTSSRIRYSVIENIKKNLSINEYIVRQGMNEVMILFRSDKRLGNRLEKIMGISSDLKYCYVGEPDIIAEKTVTSVIQVAHIARIMHYSQKFLTYEEVFLECLLDEVIQTKRIDEIILRLKEKDTDGVLKDTIMAYVEDNDNYAVICEKLHVHRNTLNYRLSRIEEIFNCNPRRIKDLMLLYISIIKMGNEKDG